MSTQENNEQLPEQPTADQVREYLDRQRQRKFEALKAAGFFGKRK